MSCGKEYSSLHGMCRKSSDNGYFEPDKHQSSNVELVDDVFALEEDKPFLRRKVQDYTTRADTTRSSGYVSDISPSIALDGGVDKIAPSISPAAKKTSSDVSTQTVLLVPRDADVSLEAPVVELCKTAMSERMVFRKFCWRHDGYSDVTSPPARPSSPSSVKADGDDADRTNQGSNLDSPKVSFRHQSCQICKSGWNQMLYLPSRKELSSAQKMETVPTVARVKSCPVNMLSSTIQRCSNLWMENRTFYLGVDVPLPRRKSTAIPTRRTECKLLGKNQGELSINKNTNEHCEDIQAMFSEKRKHSFWVRSISVRKDTPRPRSKQMETKAKRNWILVQCVTKQRSTPICSAEPEKPLQYKDVGSQEMIFCPTQDRSVEMIEDLCCLHFFKLQREDALKAGHTVELLFSAKGPIMRDDKHLTGRSIFYFCCDGPAPKSFLCSDCKATRAALQVIDQPGVFSASDELLTKSDRRIRTTASSLVDRRGTSVGVRFTPSKATLLRACSSTRKPNSSRPSSALVNNNSAKLIKEKSPTVRPESPKRKRKEQKEVFDSEENVSMSKSVTFADQSFDADKQHSEKQSVFDAMKRRASLPPPPPQMKYRDESAPQTRRKRRESTAITFEGIPKARPKQEPLKENQKTSAVFTYNQVQPKEVKVTVMFKGQTYSKDFLERKTLQDLYSWLRQQLLQQDVLTPGADLVLTHDNLEFPLKANTASKVIGNLLATSFVCKEIKKEDQGNSGEGNGRYDTRFSLPMDIRQLETLNPIQYLIKFCTLSSTWKAFYYKTFTQNDKDKDGFLIYKELQMAMERLFVELARPLLQRCLFLMGLDPKSANTLPNDNFVLEEVIGSGNEVKDYDKLFGEHNLLPWKKHLTVNADTFVCICALANRIVCRETKIDRFPVDTIRQKGTELEDADFHDIEGKLSFCKLHPLTKRLLLYIRK